MMGVRQIIAIAVVSGLATAAIMLSSPVSAERAVTIPAAAVDARETGPTAVAVLAGGCFWGMEAVFEHVKGVKSVTSGYAGGTATTANYEAVSSEMTTHAEAIRVVYDPSKISFGGLLRIFFSVAHDPTQLNRQGPDSGTSYRSAVFAQTPEQARVIRAYIAQLTAAKRFTAPIVTRTESARFYPAEAYHQDFFARNPGHPYIVRWDKPKLAAYRAAFPTLYQN
jgi:peptide-methionine (S)-S-oxide reductase